MFVYIDESGHTGKNSKDAAQPVFHYMAAASLKNLDLDLDGRFKKILIKNGITEIHGAVNFNKIEDYAADILRILRANSVSFFYTIIEKDCMAYAKLYDTIFDNVENKGVRFQAYQVRTFRLILLSMIIEMLPVDVAHKFYEECLFAKSESDAISVLIDTCNAILSRVYIVRDERGREIITDAAKWAINNPSALTTFNADKQDRWGHLPHIAGFLPLMSMLSSYSNKHKSQIMRITHDNQDQLHKVLNEIHRVASDPNNLKTVNLGENGTIELAEIKNTVFDLRDSATSFGLQTVDICLYVLSHRDGIEQNATDWPNANALLEYVISHTSRYLLTKEYLISEAKGRYEHIMNAPLTEEDIAQGQKTVDDWERDFLSQSK